MVLVYLATAWLAGIVLAYSFHPPWQALLLLGLVGTVGLIGWQGPHRSRLVCAALLALALGAGRLLLSLPRFDSRSLATYNDLGRVTLEGTVVGEPDQRETTTSLRLRAERLTLPNGQTLEVRGLALVRVDRYPEFAYGDRLQVVGPLETPPEWEDFSYRDYLARQGIHSLLTQAQAIRMASGSGHPIYAALLALKRRAQTAIAAILHEPAASLLTGILLGVESGIPRDLMEAFSATGTTHIIAISGFNISIIAGVFDRLFRRLIGPRRATWAAIGGVLTYTLLVGASASVVRAAIMGCLYLVGRHLGRATFIPASLAGAAVLMTALNPFILWDVGFQLSFAATIGLVLYTQPLERAAVGWLSRLIPRQEADRAVGWVSEAVLVTLAAQIATTALIVYSFRRLSLVTLLTNALVLPVQPLVMTLGGLATVTGLVWPAAGQLVGWAAWLPLAYTIEVVRLTARVPYAWINLGRVEGWMVWAFYALLGLLTWWAHQSTEARSLVHRSIRTLWQAFAARLSDRLMLSLSALLLLLSAIARSALPDGRLHVDFLDVGPGDAVFVRTPSGRQVLVDGGPSPSALLAQVGRRMPFWDHSLDLVVLSHPDDDLLAGLVPLLERYRVGAVIQHEAGCQSSLCDRWQTLLSQKQTPVWRGEAGLRLALDEGLILTVLYPGADLPTQTTTDLNARSMVMRLDYGRVCFLLTGDIGPEVEQRLVQEGAWLACTVLKAAHHGDLASTTEEFLAAVDPEMVVIPASDGEGYGEPCGGTATRALLKRLEGRTVYRTDEDGTIEVISDGNTYWVR